MSFKPAAPRRVRALVPPIAGRQIVIGALLVVLLGMAYALWLRNSALVAVDEVEVRGVSMAQEEVAAALTGAAEDMTTLNVDESALLDAVEGYPTVESVSADPHFPRAITIEVVERRPVGSVGRGDGVPVAADGTVLSGVSAEELDLPSIDAKGAPASGRLEGDALTQAQVLGAAPDPLRPAIEAAEMTREWGVVVELTEKIELRFGEPDGIERKWAAAAAILADPELDSLSYIDLRVADRPAVGGAPPDPEEGVEPATELAPTEPVVPPDELSDPAAVPAPVEPAPEAASSVEPETADTPSATGVAGGAAAPPP